MTHTVKKVLALLFFVFLISFYQYLPYEQQGKAIDSISGSLFSLYFFIFNQTLGIVHEGGHGICYVLHAPRFITTLNGTLFQLLFPLGIAYYYRKRGNDFASYMAMFFVGFSLLYTAWYISTSGQGAMVSAQNSFLGVDGYHDFHYILSSMGLLTYYKGIALAVKIISYLLMILSVGFMLFDAFMRNGELSRIQRLKERKRSKYRF